MVISSVGPTDSNSYYSGISSANALSGSGLPTQDSLNLQSGSSLLQSLSQSNSVNGSIDYPTNLQQTVQDNEILATNSSVAQLVSQLDSSPLTLPTNIQQAVQDQVIMATDPNLAQTESQQTPSPLLESQMEGLQTLTAENGDESTQSDQSLTSLATSMQVLQGITNSGILANNPSLTQSLMQNYTILTNPTSLGSLVDTSA